MIKSMTAYARAETKTDALTATVEIRSYNSRFLDLVVHLPPTFIVLEEKIKGRVKETAGRGRIEVRLHIDRQTESAVEYQVDVPRAAAYYKALSELKQLFHIDEPATIEPFLTLKDVIKPVEREEDSAAIWPQIDECLSRALSEHDAMRLREGGFIGRDITHRADAVSRHLDAIKAASSGLVEIYRDRLRERIASLTHGVVDIDPGRVAQEAAILAERSDITEEVVRAASHIEQFHAVMNGEEAAGRKLNFLLQELNREFNTIGSKTDKSSVAHLVVDVKSELEKIREQVQNVE